MRISTAVLLTLAACGDGGGGGGGGAVDMSAECEAYLACATMAAEDQIATLTATLGPDSPCWAGQDEADLCTASCIDGLSAASKTSFGREEVCWSGGSPNMLGVFGLGNAETFGWSSSDCPLYEYLEANFSASESGDAFTMTIEWEGFGSYEQPCTTDGYDFACSDPQDWGATPTGTFDDGFLGGTMTVDYSGEFDCTYTGEAY